jgi:acyl-CoA thioester hydrolase
MAEVAVLEPRFVARRHVTPLRVYYEDTDAAGIVYYANYLKFTERGRTEMLRAVGADHRELEARDGVLFAVRRCEADYIRPAKLDDRIDVWTEMISATGARMDVRQTVRRGDEDLVTMQVTLACIDRAGRPKRIPERLRHIWGRLIVSG